MPTLTTPQAIKPATAFHTQDDCLQLFAELRGNLHFNLKYDLDQNFPIISKLENALIASGNSCSPELFTACQGVNNFINLFLDPTLQSNFLKAYSTTEIDTEQASTNSKPVIKQLRDQAILECVKSIIELEKNLDCGEALATANALVFSVDAVKNLTANLHSERQSEHQEQISRLSNIISNVIPDLTTLSLKLDYLPSQSLVSFLKSTINHINQPSFLQHTEENSQLLELYSENFSTLRLVLQELANDRLSQNKLNLELGADLYTIVPGNSLFLNKNQQHQEVAEGRLQYIKDQTKKFLEESFSSLTKTLSLNDLESNPLNLINLSNQLLQIHNLDQANKALKTIKPAPEKAMISFSKFREKLFSLGEKILSGVRSIGADTFIRIEKNTPDSIEHSGLSSVNFTKINFKIECPSVTNAELEIEFSNPERADQFLDYIKKCRIIHSIHADLKQANVDYNICIKPDEVESLDQLLKLIAGFSREMENNYQDIDFQFYDETSPNLAKALWRKITSKWSLKAGEISQKAA